MKLSDKEWRVLDALWTAGDDGLSLGAAVDALRPSTGWSRSTVLTYLTRMEAKGLVTIDKGASPHRYRPAVRREDAALREAESFLDRVYKGSVSLLVSALTQKQALSRREIDELYAILQQAEKEAEDNDP